MLHITSEETQSIAADTVACPTSDKKTNKHKNNKSLGPAACPHPSSGAKLGDFCSARMSELR